LIHDYNPIPKEFDVPQVNFKDLLLIRHSTLPYKDTLLISTQHGPIDELETAIKLRYQPNVDPLETILVYEKGQLFFNPIYYKLELNEHQYFLLRLEPNSPFCYELYEHIGHFKPYTAQTTHIILSKHDLKNVKARLSEEWYYALFQKPDSPKLIFLIDGHQPSESDDEFIFQYYLSKHHAKEKIRAYKRTK